MSVQNHGGHAGKAPAGTETYTDLNARVIDSWIAEGWEWGTPISHERPPEDLPEWGMQFSHTLDEQIRGQIQAGFRIVDLYEDTNGEGRLHELGIPTFWATCAEKPAAGDDPSAASHRGGAAAGRA